MIYPSNIKLQKIIYMPRAHLIILFSILSFSVFTILLIMDGNINIAIKQLIRIFIALIAMAIGCVIDVKIWKKYAFHIYCICILLLLVVTMAGKSAMGAKRWISIASLTFQPSELAKISIVFILASYYSNKSLEFNRHNRSLIVPIVLTAIPVAIVCKQPDLGTAILLLLIAISILFFVNVQIWKFLSGIVLITIMSPIICARLHPYQKQRILIFLNPEIDALGHGYHIMQSKIALGAGGTFGTTLNHGTQCNLNFLPEKQTDFIFAAIGEHFGICGCLILVALYMALIIGNFTILFNTKDKFQMIIIFAFNAILFFYASINILMVCGLAPVVGIPLPLFSYGGSSLLTLLSCQGIIFSCHADRVYHDKNISLVSHAKEI